MKHLLANSLSNSQQLTRTLSLSSVVLLFSWLRCWDSMRRNLIHPSCYNTTLCSLNDPYNGLAISSYHSCTKKTCTGSCSSTSGWYNVVENLRCRALYIIVDVSWWNNYYMHLLWPIQLIEKWSPLRAANTYPYYCESWRLLGLRHKIMGSCSAPCWGNCFLWR